MPPNPERHPDIRCDEDIGAAESVRSDANDCVRLAVNLQRAADKIAAATHPFPESIARYYDWNICVRPALLCRVKAASPWLHAHEREVILRSQKRETAPHVVIASDAGHGKIDRAYIGKHIFAVLAQLTEFIVGKLAIIVRGILPGRKNIHDLLRMKRHHRLEHHAIDERENGRVNTDSQRQGQQHHRRKPRRLDELSNSKFEILNHRRSISLCGSQLRCGQLVIRIQLVKIFSAKPTTKRTIGFVSKGAASAVPMQRLIRSCFALSWSTESGGYGNMPFLVAQGWIS